MFFPKDKKVLIVGVGQTLCGDDGVGPYIVEELKKHKIRENVSILNAEEVPEIYTDKIISYSPDYILIIDAVDFKKSPGEFALISPDILKQKVPSTHNSSLKLVVDYIKSRINTEIFILGIQPQDIEFGKETLTPSVKKTASLIVDEIIRSMENA